VEVVVAAATAVAVREVSAAEAGPDVAAVGDGGNKI